MNLPDFFSAAPTITVRDPLAALLGSASDGEFRYTYADAVRLAGHSCAAVAGAWLMLTRGLSWLYDDDRPQRGNIEVWMRDAPDLGTAGVVASIASLVTGAAAEGGFAGIGPQGLHARRGLLRFDTGIDAMMGLRRRDSGAGVLLDIDTRRVPQDPALGELSGPVLAGRAGPEQQLRFAALWQRRVQRMLVDHADDPRLVHIYDWEAP